MIKFNAFVECKKYVKIKNLSENVVGKGVEKCKVDDAKVPSVQFDFTKSSVA